MFTKKKAITLALVIGIALTNLPAFSVNADWEKTATEIKYTDDSGAYVTGWQTLNNKKYYFSSEGIMKTGWLKMTNGNKYYLKQDGSMVTGWLKLDNKNYYFNAKGIMLTGVRVINKKIYVFSNSGELSSMGEYGFYIIDNKFYFCLSDGSLAKEGVNKYKFEEEGKSYSFYVGKDGYTTDKSIDMDGYTYVFDAENGFVNSFPTIDYSKTYTNSKKGIEISDFKVKLDSISLWYIYTCEGTITNTSDSPSKIYIQCKLYDASGNLLETDYDTICVKDLAEGESYAFKQDMYTDYEVAKCIISKVEVYNP